MRNRQSGDASFLLGMVMGVFVGVAVALILSPQAGQQDWDKLDNQVEQAKESLESKADEAKDRVEGAAEGATS